ncbi:MAG: hypothetical protein LUO93_01680, partial [Methanomicrobiales archaeon]|nr:hypothetical protein [Methanomicrobiales archaeon]
GESIGDLLGLLPSRSPTGADLDRHNGGVAVDHLDALTSGVRGAGVPGDADAEERIGAAILDLLIVGCELDAEASLHGLAGSDDVIANDGLFEDAMRISGCRHGISGAADVPLWVWGRVVGSGTTAATVQPAQRPSR